MSEVTGLSGAVVLGDLSHCNATDPAIWDGNFTIKDCKMLNLPVEFTASTAIFGGYVGSVRIEHNHVANLSLNSTARGLAAAMWRIPSEVLFVLV